MNSNDEIAYLRSEIEQWRENQNLLRKENHQQAADLAAARADVQRLKDELAVAGEIAREALATTTAPPVVPLADAEKLATALEKAGHTNPPVAKANGCDLCQALAAYRAKHPKP